MSVLQEQDPNESDYNPDFDKQAKDRGSFMGERCALAGSAIGFMLILLGAMFLILTLRNIPLFKIWPAAFILVGMTLLYLCSLKRLKTGFFFTGGLLLLTGIIIFIAILDFCPWTLKELWPLITLGAAVSFFLSCLYHYRRLYAVFVVPSAVLFILGVVFFFFSTGIIRKPLRVIVASWWPALLILGGIILVVVFFNIRQNHRRDG